MGPQYRKDIVKLEGVQGRLPRLWALEHFSCEERLGELGLVSQLQGTYQQPPVPMMSNQEVGSMLFVKDNGHKYKHKRFRWAIERSLFPMRSVKPGHRLPREVVQCPGSTPAGSYAPHSRSLTPPMVRWGSESEE